MLNQQNRVFNDLYESERNMRQTAEAGTQALIKLLKTLAFRLDGERFQQMCTANPNTPGNWSINDWDMYFLGIKPSISNSGDGWGGQALERQANNLKDEQIAHLQASLARLQAQLEIAQGELKKLKDGAAQKYPHKDKLVAVPVGSAPVGEKMDPKVTFVAKPVNTETVLDDPVLVAQALVEPSSFAGILADFRKFTRQLGKPPQAYAALAAEGRSWSRYAGMVYLLGKWGISAKMELDAIVARSSGISSGSGSLRNILENLAEYRYLETSNLSLERVGVNLRFYRLTPEGAAMYQAITGENVVESEWMRLINHHEGQRFEEHTCACLAFTMHARRRGWGAQVLPETDNNSIPDVAVTRGAECFNVEVEIRARPDEKPTKLPNLAETNAGVVAICAATVESRARLVEYSRQENLPGMATDLASLMASGYNRVGFSDELWLETW